MITASTSATPRVALDVAPDVAQRVALDVAPRCGRPVRNRRSGTPTTLVGLLTSPLLPLFPRWLMSECGGGVRVGGGVRGWWLGVGVLRAGRGRHAVWGGVGGLCGPVGVVEEGGAGRCRRQPSRPGSSCARVRPLLPEAAAPPGPVPGLPPPPLTFQPPRTVQGVGARRAPVPFPVFRGLLIPTEYKSSSPAFQGIGDSPENQPRATLMTKPQLKPQLPTPTTKPANSVFSVPEARTLRNPAGGRFRNSPPEAGCSRGDARNERSEYSAAGGRAK
ncbi:hypothetical protein QFZ74_006140, partial [Streptomyces sp. V3I7]|nr:hypothetical protein [Streptomyces sp. V3I7]